MNTLKRGLIKLLGLSPFSASVPLTLAAQQAVTRIAFGSCLHQDKPQPVWEAVLAHQPDAFIFLGDNIYGDTDDPEVLRRKYQTLSRVEGFRKLRSSTPLYAIWDDHDYGRNDAGLEYPQKEESRRIMLDFWGEAADSERRFQEGGIYGAFDLFIGERRVQIILPDLRWNRSALSTVSSEQAAIRDAGNMGPYEVSSDPGAQLVGEVQWRWLEQRLSEPADVRIFGSSIQCLTEFTGWEIWSNFPRDKARLMSLLQQYQNSKCVLISGDVHWCELSVLEDGSLQYPLPELTSSGLTEVWSQISPNPLRRGNAYAVQNFGLIEINWRNPEPEISLSAIGVDGRVLISYHY